MVSEIRTAAVEEPFPRLKFEADGIPIEMGITRRGVTDPEESLAAWAQPRFHRLVRGAQVHGTTIAVVDLEPGARSGLDTRCFDACDGFVTATPGVLLAISAADCVPALVYSPEPPAIALLHAGWRGVAAGIVPLAVTRLHTRYGVEPGSCRAIWGPAIGPCCYPVSGDVVEQLEATIDGDRGEWCREREGRFHVDLREVLTRQVVASGLERSSVTSSTLCTSCDARLESYRRDGERSGRMLFYAGLRVP